MNCRNALPALVLSMLLLFGIDTPGANAQNDDTYVSYNDFYQNLAPYGQWIEDLQYGFVWSPNVDGSFRPYYTNGYWSMTDYGNTWVSEYPWGWACFHYGRWTYDNYYGWLWIPGTDWGPAWVSWRESEGYFGWAPLGPDYTVGPNANAYYCPSDWWIFIPPQYIYSGDYYRYYYGPRGNSRIIKNSTVINNVYENNHTTYVTGPRVRQVEQASHQPVQVFKLTNSATLTTKVHNNVIKMYRPQQIRPATSTNGTRVQPPRFVTAPQPINKPEAINGRTSSTPEYKNDVPNTNVDAIGTHVNEPVKARPQRRNVTNPYEYDVNRPVQQPRAGEAVPQQNIREQIQPQQPQPTQISRPRPPVINEPRQATPGRQAPTQVPQQVPPVRQAPPPAQQQAPAVRQAPQQVEQPAAAPAKNQPQRPGSRR